MNLQNVDECINSCSSISVTSARSAREKYVLQASDPFVSVFVHSCYLFLYRLYRLYSLSSLHSALLILFLFTDMTAMTDTTFLCLGVPNIPGDWSGQDSQLGSLGPPVISHQTTCAAKHKERKQQQQQQQQQQQLLLLLLLLLLQAKHVDIWSACLKLILHDVCIGEKFLKT